MNLTTPLFAAGLPLDAQPVAPGIPITGSMVMAIIVLCLGAIVAFGIGQPSAVPGKIQNFLEGAIESMIKMLEPILGWHVLKGTFWFFVALFLFILTANIIALLPGVGTIGYGYEDHGHFYVKYPFFRGANADVNLTLAMSAVFMGLWLYWGIYYNGLWGFILHIFGPKGESKGLVAFLMIFVFIIVGVLEVISIAVRPVALTFRLFGNIYGGEAMIHIIEGIVAKATGGGWLGAIAGAAALTPLYLFELLVAFVQALVFLLLCAVFTGMMCKHEEGHGDHHGDEEPQRSLEELMADQQRAMAELQQIKAG